MQSNDAGFELDGQLGESEQQVAMARIRAIESDRAVVYASATGDSAITGTTARKPPSTTTGACLTRCSVIMRMTSSRGVCGVTVCTSAV